MKTMLKRAVSLVLVVSMLLGIMPVAALAQAAQTTYSLDNGYIKVTVSAENGGFAIRTQDGNRLNKDDNNQNLLYHNGEYDTSFTSFRVTYPSGSTKDYLFGGDYSYEGSKERTPVSVSQDATGISAVWAVEGIAFTQRIELSNVTSNEHGMVRISYNVSSTQSLSKVEARVLLDTALGSKDYAYYEVYDEGSKKTTTYTKEVVLQSSASQIPARLYGCDDINDPSITAYTVNASPQPYQAAFGHWNNLASTLFDFVPTTDLTFTNPYNKTYETADSACALYYDLGPVSSTMSAFMSTYYGVYSNQHVSSSDSVAINLTAPTALSLVLPDKKQYAAVGVPGGKPNATFPVSADITIVDEDTIQSYPMLAIAAYASTGITPLNDGGDLYSNYSYSNPYVVMVNPAAIVGDTMTNLFLFNAVVGSEASYRKVELRVFGLARDPETGGYKQDLLTENLLGYVSHYILCPGGDGELPKVTFTNAAPKILYNEGKRRLTLTGMNFNMLGTNYQVLLKGPTSVSSANQKAYMISPSNVSFSPADPGDTSGATGIMDIYITQEMVPGEYVVSIEFGSPPPEGFPASLTAPALRVTMTEDKAFKNDTYGVIVVGQSLSGNSYQIRSFASEELYGKGYMPGTTTPYEPFSETLLVFRGEFTSEEDGHGRLKYKATSTKSNDNNGNSVVANPITLNNCIDFDNGTVSIYYDYDSQNPKSVCVDFDGDLWTSNSRTSIWKGVAALTEIKNGTDYGLVHYNKNGGVTSSPEKTITLIWPCGLGLAQTIGGMIFKLAYGTLGVMYDTDGTTVLGHVLSFSASMDLSFLVPSKKQTEEEKAWNKMQEHFNVEDQDGKKLRNRWNGLDFTSNQIGDEGMAEGDQKGQASVMVDNILYGCGKGFIGFRCNVKVGLPPYIDAMPAINADLTINTIGDWSFAVDGSAKFTTIEIEVSIAVKSHNGAPIPDKMYFFITGFEPGINVDGFGVIWITGGGGGFDNLYDTIFAGSSVPPLKLLISITFDILKVLSARADLSLSLRGLALNVSNVKIKFTNIVALNSAALEFDWYPGWYFMASVSASLLDVITGSGYIVVIDNETYDGFVEFFLRVRVAVPPEVPVFGGMEFGGADLGVNNEKIWGAVTALGVGVGIVYWWGGDFEFGFKTGAKPTFPELLGYEDIPVYYDEEQGRTLYMRVGTNFSVAAMAEMVEDLGGTPVLMGTAPYVRSNPYKTDHRLYLGDAKGAGDPVDPMAFSISFPAESMQNARDLARQIVISDGPNGTGAAFGVQLYNTDDPDDLANPSANANLTYSPGTDPDTGTASLGITATDSADFGKVWYINTPVESDIILYSVGAIPEIARVEVDPTLTDNPNGAGKMVNVTWDGTLLDQLDSVSFYLTIDDGADDVLTDGGAYLGTLGQRPNPDPLNTQDIMDRAATFAIPGDLPTDDYYVRAVYTKADVVSGSKTSSSGIRYTNNDQPGEPRSVGIENAGDRMFRVTVANNDAEANYDGYILNIYEPTTDPQSGTKQWVPTSFINMVREKQLNDAAPPALVMPEMLVGGVVDGLDAEGNSAKYGLQPGTSYKVGVTAFKNVYDQTNPDTVLYTVKSDEVCSDPLELRAATPPVVTLTNLTLPYTELTRLEYETDDDTGVTAMTEVAHETYAENCVEFSAGFSELADPDDPMSLGPVGVTGTWSLDSDALTGSFTTVGDEDDEVLISLPDTSGLPDPSSATGLSDGDHTLTIQGKDGDGDSFRFTKSFTIDTMPPRLMLSSPTNGGFFNRNGTLDISGVTDPDALFTVVVDGNTVHDKVPVTTLATGTGAIDKDGVFRFAVDVDRSVSSHDVLVVANDEMGNFSQVQAQVNNRGLADVKSIDIYMYMDGDRVKYSNVNLPTGLSTRSQLSLVATAGSGSTATQFEITDNNLVSWRAETVRGSASIGPTGLLTVSAGSVGHVVGSFKVADNASMTAAATFGAEAFSAESHDLVMGATIGGTASIVGNSTGMGRHAAGAEVEIVAVPNPGYRFMGWTSKGGSYGDGAFADSYAASTVFTMPGGDVTVTARFEPIGSGSEDDDDYHDDYGDGELSIWADFGQLVVVDLPPGANENTFVPYYLENGRKVIVPLSKVEDGKLIFRAPVGGTYGFAEYDGSFGDADGHWAEDFILFAAARGLFGGVGEDLFNPDGSMTRAMFVTVLSRLEAISGASNSGGAGRFPDVPPEEWYSSAVAWASQNGIVGGYDDGTFGPDDPITREQMCVIFLRYLQYKGYSLGDVADSSDFSDADDIGSWALDAVSICQRAGLISGKPGNVFDPQANSTRAEVCTVFYRLIGAILRSLK